MRSHSMHSQRPLQCHLKNWPKKLVFNYEYKSSFLSILQSCLFDFAKSNTSILFPIKSFFSQILLWKQPRCGPFLWSQLHVALFLNCIFPLYLIIIQNDRWPQGAVSCNCSAISINHKQLTHSFGVHFQLKMNLNGRFVNKVIGKPAHKV